MDIFRMRCLVSASETLNFSQTARELFVTQPAVTQQIAAAEKELGIRIFCKRGKKLELTQAGAIFTVGAKSILLAYDNLCLQAKRAEALGSEVRIAYHGPIDWGTMSSLVYAYKHDNPDVQINIRTDHWGKLMHDLSRGSLDVVFTEKSEMAAYPDLRYIDLFTEGACICVAKDDPLAAFSMITPEMLRGRSLIMTTSPESSASMDAIIARLSACGIDIPNARYVTQFETAMTMVAAGMGITFFPESFKIYEHPSLVFIDLDAADFYMDMVLAFSPGTLTPPVERFVDLCKRWDFAQE